MKMRLIHVLIILCLILCGCKGANAPLKSPSGDTVEYPESDLAGTNVTYVKTESGFIPISVVKNGNSMLSGENYYYDLVNSVENDSTVSEKTFTAFDGEGNNVGAVNIEKDSRDPYTHLYTSGNWKLCPVVRRTQSQDENYKQFILESFADKFTKPDDVTVTDILQFDIDGDGLDEAAVTAKGDGYTVSVLLSQSLGNKVLASAFDTPDFDCKSFVADFDGNGDFSLATLSGGSFMKLTVCKEKTADTDYTVYLPLK